VPFDRTFTGVVASATPAPGSGDSQGVLVGPFDCRSRWTACGPPTPVNNRQGQAGLARSRERAREGMSEAGSRRQSRRYQWRLGRGSAQAGSGRQGFIGGRRFGSGKRRRWCVVCGKESRCHRDTEIFGVPVVRQEVSVDSLDGLAFTAEQAGAGFDPSPKLGSAPTRQLARATECGNAGMMDTARRSGTNRSATRGRGSPQRKLVVSRRHAVDCVSPTARACGPYARQLARGQSEPAVEVRRRVISAPVNRGIQRVPVLTMESVASIGERRLLGPRPAVGTAGNGGIGRLEG
jgi:hypothetical protein